MAAPKTTRDLGMNLKTLAHALGGDAISGAVSAPGPGHSKLDRSMRVFLDPADCDGFRVDSFCGNDWRLCRDHVRRLLGAEPLKPKLQWRAQASRREPDASSLVASLWREARDPRRTPAETYLNCRGLNIDDDLAVRVLRYHPHCVFGEGARHPCLLAAFHPIVGLATSPRAILRVALTARAEKIGKKMLGPVKGCAIKLDADEHVLEGLGIAEGLETSLSVRQAGWRPVWCLGSAGAIADFAPMPGIEALSIFADHDENGTGMAAAHKCAARWVSARKEATIWEPRRGDWNDIRGAS